MIIEKENMDYRVFIDSDVLLDVLAKREKFYENSSIILELIKDEKIKGHTFPVVISNVYYILTKYGNEKIAKENVKKILKLLSVLSITEEIIYEAVNSKMKDFEDAIQYFTAMNNQIDVLITRNTKEYIEKKKVEVMKPEEFIKIFSELK